MYMHIMEKSKAGKENTNTYKVTVVYVHKLKIHIYDCEEK